MKNMIVNINVWTLENWKKELSCTEIRRGLRLVIDKEVIDEVRTAFKEFAAWLRKEYYFPLRVPVYVKNSYRITARDGEAVVGLFFEPNSVTVEPYIKLAVGDFESLKQERGAD